MNANANVRRGLTDEDCPDIDEDEESDVSEFLQREDEWEDMIRYALRESVYGMECMARIRRRHNPPVMRLV